MFKNPPIKRRVFYFYKVVFCFENKEYSSMNYSPQINLHQVISNLKHELICPQLSPLYVQNFSEIFSRLPNEKEVQLKLEAPSIISNNIYLVDSVRYSATYMQQGVVCTSAGCTQRSEMNPKKFFEHLKKFPTGVYIVSLLGENQVYYDIMQYAVKPSEIISINSSQL